MVNNKIRVPNGLGGFKTVGSDADKVDLIASTPYFTSTSVDGALIEVSTRLLEGKVSKGTLVYNVDDYGADPTGVVNSRTAIQAAINAAPPGSSVYLPGRYLLSGSGTELLLITKPLRFIGNGMYSQLLIDYGVPNTTDVIRVSPNTSMYKELSSIEGLHIIPVSGEPARHGIHFDLSGPGQYISKLVIRNNYIHQLGGNGLRLSNPTNVDGFFTSIIEDNLIFGGTYWQRIGDSVHFERNTFTGKNTGIELSGVSGAVSCTIQKNNITSAGGAVKASGSAQLKILFNQMEQVSPYTGTVDSMVYIDSAVMCEVHGNNMNAHSNVAHCIRINTYRTKISKNNMVKGTAEAIRLDASANKTDIAYDNYYVNSADTEEIAPSILNNGIGTIGVAKALALANGWAADDPTNFNAPSVTKDSSGIVHFLGKLTSGTLTAGTVITSLPVGYRPSKALSAFACFFNFTTLNRSIITLIISSGGDITLESALPNSGRLDLDGLSFVSSY